MKFNGTSVKINSVFNLNSMSVHSIQCQFNEMQCQLKEVQLQFMSIQWNSNSIQFQFNVNSFSIFNFNSMNFKLSAKRHGSCRAPRILYIRESRSSSSSRHLQLKWRSSFEVLLLSWVNALTVSQVLDSSDSSSNGNVTQVLPANSRRTASNVSSEVERARSMLERSRNRGLCSRLNQRERLPDIPTLPIWLRVSLFVVLSPTLPIVIRSSRVILKF